MSSRDDDRRRRTQLSDEVMRRKLGGRVRGGEQCRVTAEGVPAQCLDERDLKHELELLNQRIAAGVLPGANTPRPRRRAST